MSVFLAIFWHQLWGYRGAGVGWGLGLGGYAAMALSSWTVMRGQGDAILEVLKNYPPEMMAFFGDLTRITQPAGFLDVYFFAFVPLIFGIFLIGASTGLLVQDEEAGRLDLLMAYPASRATLFAARTCALLAATVGLLVIPYVTLVVGAPMVELPVGAGELALPFAGAFTLSVLFVGIGLLASLCLPSRRSALMVSGMLLVASYLFPPLAELNSSLEPVAALVPGYYYQGGEALEDFKLAPVLGFLAFAAVLLAASMALFGRRDIRVGGEGNLSWLRGIRAVTRDSG